MDNDDDVKLTLSAHHTEPNQRKETAAKTLDHRLVQIESVFGGVAEFAIFLVAQSCFFEEGERSNLYYILKCAVEELALFLSWEFWERPGYRTIMLKQLTVRNILFQLRYLPSFDQSSLKQVYLLQPIVVLSLALIHIVVERVASYSSFTLSEARELVSSLFFQVGVHAYLALLLCESMSSAPPSRVDGLLWLRTCLITFVFQNQMLMFAVAMVVFVFNDATLVVRMFDMVVFISSAGLVEQTLRNKSHLNMRLSFDSARLWFQHMIKLSPESLRAYGYQQVRQLHPLAEMLGFLAETVMLFVGTSAANGVGPVCFVCALCLCSLETSPTAKTRFALYLLEVLFAGLAFAIRNYDLIDDPMVGSFMSLSLSAVACVLSWSGLRDLAHIALL
jgi:hypothetical protein